MSDSDMTWSWSRINYTCLADFYQTYILDDKGESNGWANLGKLCHSIVEDVANQKITQKEGLQLFKDNYWDVVADYPFPATPYWPDPEQSYYDKILPWFEKKVWWEGDVVSVEEHIEFTLPSGEKVQGYVDQLRQEDDKLVLTDFKVAKAYTGKELNKKIMQLYLYAYGYHQKTGVYPYYLEYIWFQNKYWPTRVPFNKGDMEKTLEFCEKRIELLKKKINLAKTEKGHFPPDALGDYFCSNLCSHRNKCPFKSRKND